MREDAEEYVNMFLVQGNDHIRSTDKSMRAKMFPKTQQTTEI